MNITYNEYWTEISELADSMACEAMQANDNDIDAARDDIFDSRLHETVDSHQWIIYYAYSLDVIDHSDNEDYYNDNFGGEALAASLNEGGLNTLHCHIAFWCMYADICDKIDDSLTSYEKAA